MTSRAIVRPLSSPVLGPLPALPPAAAPPDVLVVLVVLDEPSFVVLEDVEVDSDVVDDVDSDVVDDVDSDVVEDDGSGVLDDELGVGSGVFEDFMFTNTAVAAFAPESMVPDVPVDVLSS